MSRFISSHLISSPPFGVYASVSFHAPGSLIKCRGSLVVRPPEIPNHFKFSQTSCCQKQIPHKHPDVAYQNSPAEAESVRNCQITCSEFASIQIFHPQILTCHPEFMFTSQSCHNQALRETAPCRYQLFLSVVGCLLNSRKF